MLARCRARRQAPGADRRRAGNRQNPPGGGIVRMVLAPGRRGGARAMLLRLRPPRLRSHRRLAAVGAFERRLRATGPGAARGTGARDAGDTGAVPSHPTAAAPGGELGAAAFLPRPERGVRQGPRTPAPADRRLAVVRCGLLRMAALAVSQRHGVTNPGGRHRAARRDRTDSPARRPVERPAPVRASRGASPFASQRRRDRGVGGPGGRTPAGCRRSGRPLPGDERQSPVRGGKRARGVAQSRCKGRGPVRPPRRPAYTP